MKQIVTYDLTDHDRQLLETMLAGGYGWVAKASNNTLQFFKNKPRKKNSPWGLKFWGSACGELSLNIEVRFGMKMITANDAKPLAIIAALMRE